MALARLKLLKNASLLNETGSGNDAPMKQLLIVASKLVENFCSRSFESATIADEVHIGDNDRELFLNHYPVSSVTSVKIWDGDGSFDAENSSYWELMESRYIRYPKLGQEGNASYGAWPCDREIRITYVIGYATTHWDTADVPLGAGQTFAVPADLEYAVAKIAAFMWLEGRGSNESRIGKSGITVGNQSIELESILRSLDDPDVRTILKEYKRSKF